MGLGSETKDVMLSFNRGSLVLEDLPRNLADTLPGIQWDARIGGFRAPALYYRDIVLELTRLKIRFSDKAKDYEKLDLTPKEIIHPRPYQEEAMNAWLQSKRRGVVVLPTGAGKTLVALMLILKVGRPSLIHVPTIDLMFQWRDVLQRFIKADIGMFGGGSKEIRDITVTTYDSAILKVDQWGNRFGMAVYDECHHLPSDRTSIAAIASIAPFRLGLTATHERADGGESRLFQCCGPLCFQISITELTGNSLAPYDVVTIPVTMEKQERAQYEEATEIYLQFLRKERIWISGPNGWQNFIRKSSRSKAGRNAFKAYLLRKKLSQASVAKEAWVGELLLQHRKDRVLIFTSDNAMAYRLGKHFLLPVLTHQTKPRERERFLKGFHDGSYIALVTSKVLNEGVDVPEANVAIVVSGSGSVREHVQRLGRILRPGPEKKAVLYELVAKDTSETQTNQRRKRHHAYQKSRSI